MNKELTEAIRSLARSLGIIDIGVADACAWDRDELVSRIIPKNERPASLMEGARSVIVIGIPVQRSVLATAPSSYYREHYRTVNSMLDHAAQRIAMELHILGYPAAAVSRDGYQGLNALKKDPSSFFSHRHAAYMAGLGTFGMNNMLLTEKNGPRIRFTSVITTAELSFGTPMKKRLCTECMRCRKECPEDAVSPSVYPEGITLKQRCVEYSAVLNSRGCSPCGRCIFICPAGEDSGDPLPSDDAAAHIRSFTE